VVRMVEVTYLPEIECEVTDSRALPDTEIVGVADHTGNRHFLRLGKGSVERVGRKTYLRVGLADLDRQKRKALVELPLEADSGVRRLWVPFASFRVAQE
jgi:urease accessory protein UreE